MNVMKGQRTDLTKGQHLNEITLELGWTTDNAEIEIDGAAFLLSDRDICEEDGDFVFYGQPTHASGAVRHGGKVGERREVLTFAPSLMPETVHKIALTLTIHDGEENGHFFRDVHDIHIRCLNAENGRELLKFEFGEELERETAIVTAELYRHKEEWKFAAVGSGYNGGLEALCESYGLDVADDSEDEDIEQEKAASAAETGTDAEDATASNDAPPQSSQTAAPSEKAGSEPDSAGASADVPAPPVRRVELSKPTGSPVVLEKIQLSKPGSVSIRKSDSAMAMLVWENPSKDLDLYCFYVTKSGECGKVYYKNRGSGQRPPYIELDRDSRGAGQETIRLYRTDELKYVLFCAYSAVSNGFGSFKGMKARAVVDNGEGQRVESWLQKKNMFSYWVAIAKIDFTGEDRMEVSQVETYSKSGVENSPLLYADGRFEMNVGPVEFKGR
ncbi:tellurium resistance protein [Saccharibacillus sp. O23]|uniref:TerD family protein n=1 Tax=Saccharibacillus sp. O23 TaxID=2009338 RepID=UPI000B4E6214|nr:TerD family protein [Saccharibacillus sp. O23]OWR31072.1 tellurium resistance protein [Saccharibacillus sp. O23]